MKREHFLLFLNVFSVFSAFALLILCQWTLLTILKSDVLGRKAVVFVLLIITSLVCMLERFIPLARLLPYFLSGNQLARRTIPSILYFLSIYYISSSHFATSTVGVAILCCIIHGWVQSWQLFQRPQTIDSCNRTFSALTSVLVHSFLLAFTELVLVVGALTLYDFVRRLSALLVIRPIILPIIHGDTSLLSCAYVSFLSLFLVILNTSMVELIAFWPMDFKAHNNLLTICLPRTFRNLPENHFLDYLPAFRSLPSSSSQRLFEHYQDLLKAKLPAELSTYKFSLRYLMQIHAFHESNQIIRCNEQRRRLLFQNTSSWSKITGSCLETLINFAREIKSLEVFFKEKYSYDVMLRDIRQYNQQWIDKVVQKSITPPVQVPLFPKRQVSKEESNKSADDDKTNRFEEAARKFLERVFNVFRAWIEKSVAVLAWSTYGIYTTLFGLPFRGELATSRVVSPSLRSYLERCLSSVHAQELVHCAENVSTLLHFALSEDAKEFSSRTIPAALYVLVMVDDALDAFTDLLHQSHTAQISRGSGVVEYIRFKVRSSQYMPQEVIAVRRAIKEGILKICTDYRDILKTSDFPDEARKRLALIIGK